MDAWQVDASEYYDLAVDILQGDSASLMRLVRKAAAYWLSH